MPNWNDLLQRIPTHIKLKKAIYEIVWVDEFKDPKQVGETRFEPKQIFLKLWDSPKETVHTYWHEILHAISEEFEVNLTEKQVKRLEKSLISLLTYGNIFTKRKKNETNQRKRKTFKKIRRSFQTTR